MEDRTRLDVSVLLGTTESVGTGRPIRHIQSLDCFRRSLHSFGGSLCRPKRHLKLFELLESLWVKVVRKQRKPQPQ